MATLRRRTRLPGTGQPVGRSSASPRTAASSPAAASTAGCGCGRPTTWQPGRPRDRRHRRACVQAISPDSRTLAAGGDDGAIRLVRPAHPAADRYAAARAPATARWRPLFTRDGAYLFGVTESGRAYRWDVRPVLWARHACAVAGRRLTRAEWSDVLPGRDYAPAC